MRRVVLVLALILTSCSAIPYVPASLVDRASIISTAYHATGVLYDVDKTGKIDEMEAECTVWNVAKLVDGYEAVTAAHCIETGTIYRAYYGDVTAGEIPKISATVPVRVIAVGDKDTSNDIALLDVKTTAVLPVLPLGPRPAMGDGVMAIGAPFGAIVKGLYEGHVVYPSVKSHDTTLNGMIFVILPGDGPGGSGSAVFNEQGQVIGILTLYNPEGGSLLVPSAGIAALMKSNPTK